MVGIHGISGIRQPVETKRADDRDKQVETQDMALRDGVEISQEAQRAAEAERLLGQVEKTNEVRAERIAQAKENLEQGTYKVQEVVLQVAARISGYVSQYMS